MHIFFFLLLHTGVYIKFEIHIFVPPPFLKYICSPNEIRYKEGMRAAGEKFSSFISLNVNFKSIREKYAFPPFFHPLSIIFSPTWHLAIFLPPPPGGGGVKQKNIHPCLYTLTDYSGFQSQSQSNQK